MRSRVAKHGEPGPMNVNGLTLMTMITNIRSKKHDIFVNI
jgi:hypothetical protein